MHWAPAFSVRRTTIGGRVLSFGDRSKAHTHERRIERWSERSAWTATTVLTAGGGRCPGLPAQVLLSITNKKYLFIFVGGNHFVETRQKDNNLVTKKKLLPFVTPNTVVLRRNAFSVETPTIRHSAFSASSHARSKDRRFRAPKRPSLASLHKINRGTTTVPLQSESWLLPHTGI